MYIIFFSLRSLISWYGGIDIYIRYGRIDIYIRYGLFNVLSGLGGLMIYLVRGFPFWLFKVLLRHQFIQKSFTAWNQSSKRNSGELILLCKRLHKNELVLEEPYITTEMNLQSNEYVIRPLLYREKNRAWPLKSSAVGQNLAEVRSQDSDQKR